MNELNLMAKEEKKIFDERRDDLIRQIRELEKLPIKRQHGFDPTETPGYGLLEEMSLVELKERLALQKKMLSDEINSKKEENKLKMKERADDLINKALIIQENRDKQRNQKEIERKMKKEERDNLNERYRIERERNIFKYKQTIEEKKKRLKNEDEIFQKKIREIKLQQQFNQLGRDAVEFKQFQNIEDGMEKKVNDKQNQALVDQLAEERINWEKINIRYNGAKKNNKYCSDLLKNYNDSYLMSSALNDLINHEDKIYKKAVNDRERALHRYLQEDNKINFNEQKCINEDNIKIKEIIKKKQKEEIIKKRKEDEEKRSQIRDLFKCYICYNQLQNPRMCKFCKKMACEQCLKMWFQTKKSCGFCRAKIVFMDTIKVPFDNDFSSYFMDKVEKQSIISNEMDYNVINSQNKGILDNEYSPDGSKDYNYEDYKNDICIEHKIKYEYFCVQCNKNYCSKCLVFFNDSTKKHENHLILPLNESTKNESVNEYKKLNITKENIDKLINLCNLKIKELYCEKKQNIKFFDLIKNNLDNKYYNCLKYFKNKNNEMKLKEEECTRAIETTFNALNNIIKLKDYGQGQQIYEHIKGLIGYSQNIREIEFKLKNFFIESFISQQFEFVLPQEGDFVKGFEVYRNNLNNFIPNNDCKVLFIYKNKNIIINIIIKKREKNDNDKKIKYYGYIIFQKKNECEMKETEQSYSPYDEHILNIKCDSNNFISFKDENNKIKFKIFILKHENK